MREREREIERERERERNIKFNTCTWKIEGRRKRVRVMVKCH